MERKVRIIEGIDRIELFGNLDVNLNLIKEAAGVEIFQRGDELTLKTGAGKEAASDEEKEQALELASGILSEMMSVLASG